MIRQVQRFLDESAPLRGTVIFGAVISSYIAFLNGYPLVYQDTGTYIHTVFEGILPADRPVFYGFLIYLFSTPFTLFPVVFVQALLVCLMIHTTMGMFMQGARRSVYFLALITLLTLFTSYSYIVSTLVPDIFTPIVFLCFVNLLLNHRLRSWHLFLVALLFVYGICTQYSSLYVMAISVVLLLSAWLLSRIRHKTFVFSGRRTALVAALVCAPFLILPLTNYLYKGEFRTQSAAHVFFINHANETGVLKVFLDEDCPRGADYKLCAYRDSLVWDFIWQDHSPLYKTGGWEANRDEYNRMMWEMLTRKKFLFPLLHKGIEYTLRQLFTFDVPLAPPQVTGSAPFGQVAWRYHPTLRDYQNSSHYNNRLPVKVVNEYQRILLFMAMLVIFTACAHQPTWRGFPVQLRVLLVITIIYMVIQAGFSANMSTIDSRYHSRLTWLLPVLACLCVVNPRMNENGR